MDMDVRFVQLEPAAVLSDAEFQAMSPEERGVYWSILLNLYCNNGRLTADDPGMLARLSGCAHDEEKFTRTWRTIEKKFQRKNGYITHKRVTAELRKARKYGGKKNKFTPPTLDEVRSYIRDNPELSNIDAMDFWKGYADGGWVDTQGKPVRNWKLKLRTRSKYATGAKDRPSYGSGNRRNTSFEPEPDEVEGIEISNE